MYKGTNSISKWYSIAKIALLFFGNCARFVCALCASYTQIQCCEKNHFTYISCPKNRAIDWKSSGHLFMYLYRIQQTINANIDYRKLYIQLINTYLWFVAAPTGDWTQDLQFTRLTLYHWAIKAVESKSVCTTNCQIIIWNQCCNAIW